MWLKSIKWVVYSNLWVSISVVAFTFYGHQLKLIAIPPLYFFIVFFATLFAYNFQRLVKVKSTILALSERHIWINKNFFIIRLITIFSGLTCSTLALVFMKNEVLVLAIPLVVIVLVYAGNKFIKYPIRIIPFVKIVAISLVWTAVIYALPFVNENENWQNIKWAYLWVVFLLTFALCIPFDIRDLDTDLDVVKTIPSLVGVMKAKLLMLFVLALIIIASVWFQWWALAVVCIISIIMGILTKKSNSELFFTGGIDGIFVLLPLLHYAIELIG